MPAQTTNQTTEPTSPGQTVVQSPSPAPRVEPEKQLFSWKAPSRPFKKRGREFWVRLIAAASILGFILFLVEGAMPVILMIAVIFLFYILSTVEPEEMEYKITNYGVKIGDVVNAWELITRFWFTKRAKTDLLTLETLTIPGRLELVVDDKDKEKLREVLAKYIIEEETPQTNFDRASEWLSRRLS